MVKFVSHLDLRAKISLILVGVILPTFLIVTIAQNKLTRPLLEEEIRQIGLTTAKTLAAEIANSRLFSTPEPVQAIENQIQELLFSHPNIVRIDVFQKDHTTGLGKLIASNMEEEEPGSQLPTALLIDSTRSEFETDEEGSGYWKVIAPIEHRVRESGREVRGQRKILGNVHVTVTTKLIGRLMSAFWKITAVAAAFSVVTLILLLSYFLRKTIENERLLQRAKNQNIQLTEQLHEAQRQIMNTEKLAVMGQLTASFAHEIGTPLNAISGHLQLLQEELGQVARSNGQATLIAGSFERLQIIGGQLLKIETVVKNFLQSTVKPASQSQLVDINRIIDKSISILQPRIDATGIEVRRVFDRKIGPLRAVPLDMEQMILNLLSNSLDSLKEKNKFKEKDQLLLEVSSKIEGSADGQWARICIYDTGVGISRADLGNVLKPFFTTKPPGEGTGFGLTICRQLAHKYGGFLEIDSRQDVWTRVVIKIPYSVVI